MSLSPVRTAENLTLTWMFADREACQIWFLGQPDDDADDDMRLHFWLSFLFQRDGGGGQECAPSIATEPRRLFLALIRTKNVITNQSAHFSLSMHQLMRVTTTCGGGTQ